MSIRASSLGYSGVARLWTYPARRALWPRGRTLHIWQIGFAGGFRPIGPIENTGPETVLFERSATRRLLAWVLRAYGLGNGPLLLAPGRGKPRLAHAPQGRDFSFSVSRADSRAVVAIAPGGAVGVDIERVGTIKCAAANVDQRRSAHAIKNKNLELEPEASRQQQVLQQMQPVIDHFFSPAEQRDWHRKDPAEQLTAFYRCWTAKEALSKATGDGLLADFPSLCVQYWGSGRIRLRHGSPRYSPARWSLRTFETPCGMVGSVAWDRPIENIAYWSLPIPKGEAIAH